MEPGQEWVAWIIIGGGILFGVVCAIGLWLKEKLQVWGRKHGMKIFDDGDSP